MPTTDIKLEPADTLLTLLENDQRGIVFVFGSALTMPESDRAPGVPDADGMVQLVRDEIRRHGKTHEVEELDRRLAGNQRDQYQLAFEFITERRSVDAANRIIRKGVLKARIPGYDDEDTLRCAEAQVDFEEACGKLEDTSNGWHLRPSLKALGELLVKHPNHFAKEVLTTNFDPLIEVAIAQTHGSFHRTVLHGDQGLRSHGGQGNHIVYLHGAWIGSDTLHAPRLLAKERPQLKKSLERLQKRTIVVMGYGGWDDILGSTLSEIATDDEADVHILWGFYENDTHTVYTKYEHVLARLNTGAAIRSRIRFFSGVDLHKVLPSLLESLDEEKLNQRSPWIQEYLLSTVSTSGSRLVKPEFLIGEMEKSFTWDDLKRFTRRLATRLPEISIETPDNAGAIICELARLGAFEHEEETRAVLETLIDQRPLKSTRFKEAFNLEDNPGSDLNIEAFSFRIQLSERRLDLMLDHVLAPKKGMFDCEAIAQQTDENVLFGGSVRIVHEVWRVHREEPVLNPRCGESTIKKRLQDVNAAPEQYNISYEFVSTRPIELTDSHRFRWSTSRWGRIEAILPPGNHFAVSQDGNELSVSQVELANGKQRWICFLHDAQRRGNDFKWLIKSE